jgi:lipopolysaccharide transport protein LptA
MTGRTRARDRRGRAKFRTVGVFRTLFVVLFAAIVLTIAVYFARHVRAPQNLEPDQKRGVPDTPNVKEQVSIVQFNFAVGRMEARAARNVEIDEKTGRLEGSVSVVDHGKKGGREIRFFADSVTYAKDWSRFFLEGRVKIRHGEIVVDASDFLYEKEADSFTTSKGVTLTAPRFSGSSRSASYSLRDEDFVLEGDLRLNVLPRLSAVPVVLSGPRARLTYSPRRRQAVIEGGVDIAYGRSRGGAERVGFDQFEKVDDISLLWLDGGARIAVEGEVGPKANPAAGKNAPAALPEDMTISRDFLFDRSLRQEIEADEIRFRAYLDNPAVRTVEGRGRCAFKFFYEDGTATEIGGESVDVNFNPDGTLRDMASSGAARVASLDKNKAIVRLIEGPSMFLQAETNILKVKGSPTDKARIKAGPGDVSGDEVTVLIKMDDFEITGGVRMLFSPAAKPGDRQGFFAPGEQVFIDAQTVRYSSVHKRFLIWSETGTARAWQGKRVLSAREIDAAEDGGDILCQGKVLASFPHKPKDGRPETRVEIGAAKMSYDAKANRIVYEGGASLKAGAVALACRTLTVDPGESGGEPRTMRAAGAVTIVMPFREATGEQADYDVEKDTIALTGRPVLKDKDKGIVQGDKLTFRLTDGSILVESRDQNRPVTSVIK